MEMDDIHARHAAVQIRQVGADAGDVPVDLRPLADDVVADRVLARDHVERADPVLDSLGAVGQRADGDGLPLGRGSPRMTRSHPSYLRSACELLGASALAIRDSAAATRPGALSYASSSAA